MKSLYIFLFFLFLLGHRSLQAQAGSLDPEFGGGDGLVSTAIYSNQRCEGNVTAIQGDGKILVSGYTRATDGNDYACLIRYNPDGTLDPSFNGTGNILLTTPFPYSYGCEVLIQPDKKILMTLEANDSTHSKMYLYRFMEDGTPDQSFHSDGRIEDTFGAKYLGANGLALQADGKILVGGYVEYAKDTFDRLYVCRFLPNGTPDNTFDGDGIVITPVGENYSSLKSLLVLPDGKIIAVGYATFNGYYDFVALRYNSNGSLDHSFNNTGIQQVAFTDHDDLAYAAALQPDNKIILAGRAYDSSTGWPKMAVARLNADGTLDSGFHGNGMVTINVSSYADAIRALLLQPDGKIVLGGYAHSALKGGSDMALVRLNGNGMPDPDFNGDGVKVFEDNAEISSIISSLAMQSDGKIVATGVGQSQWTGCHPGSPGDYGSDHRDQG